MFLLLKVLLYLAAFPFMLVFLVISFIWQCLMLLKEIAFPEQSMESIIITAEARKGMKFEDAARQAVTVKDLVGQDIEFIFDNVRLIVGQGDSVDSLKHRYTERIDA